MAKQKVCLAYSGGLDTSCILQYLLVSRLESGGDAITIANTTDADIPIG